MGNYQDYARDNASRLNEELRQRSERLAIESLMNQVRSLEERITYLLAELERVSRELGNRSE